MFVFASSSGRGGTIFESATFGEQTQPYGFGIDWQYLGTAFTLTKPAHITAIGGTFVALSGTIFGAIVPLSGPTALPNFASVDIEQHALAATTFIVRNTEHEDVSAPLQITLGPGSYGLIFGSLNFGAMGAAFASGDNHDIGTPFRFFSQFGGSFFEFPADGVRVFIEGEVLPTVSIPFPVLSILVMLIFAITTGCIYSKT